MTKTALVTGASSGIGEETARTLHRLGYTVYAAARRTDRLQKLANGGIHALAMDVTDDKYRRHGGKNRHGTQATHPLCGRVRGETFGDSSPYPPGPCL